MSHHPDDALLAKVEGARTRARRVRADTIEQAHGGGGKAMRDLLEDVIAGELGGADLEEDQARFALTELTGRGDRLAFTTDSYVVSPLFFPGGDIGKLAVNGTVNDLAVGGAVPLWLSCGLVIEEGLAVEDLRRVLRSMREAAQAAGVRIVTGDTKVVGRGQADKLFVNTAGIGVIPAGVNVSAKHLRPGDVVLVSGNLGDHGAAILVARGNLQLETDIPSDTAPLHAVTAALVAEGPVHAMRDATRGGLAAVLNEWAGSSGVAIVVDEVAIPVRREVRGFCEILGLDPVHMANEGRMVVAVPADAADAALAVLRRFHPQAARIGEVRPGPARVTMRTGFGGERILDVLVGEQLPRIC